jgi:hypothetical protein
MKCDILTARRKQLHYTRLRTVEKSLELLTERLRTATESVTINIYIVIYIY